MNPFERIVGLLTEAKNPDRHFPATLLYNEGWMLRLVIDWFANQPHHSHPLAFMPEATWFSEALLPSQFFADRRGDPLAEGWTHADSVIGHVSIGEGALANTKLKPGAKQFIVTEAKLFSPLSSGVKNASFFDQAARNVACMAQVMSAPNITRAELTSVGFHVLAPDAQISSGLFVTEMSRDSILDKVTRRIDSYSDLSIRNKKLKWLDDHFRPTLIAMNVSCLSWEELIAHVTQRDAAFGSQLTQFYSLCVQFNRSLARTTGQGEPTVGEGM